MASILRQNDKIYRNGLNFTFRHFRFCVSGQKHQSALPASIRWTAPEILQHPNAEEGRGSVFTGACDVYSFGMLMWEMTTGLDPYEGIKDESKVSWILNTWYHYNDVLIGTDGVSNHQHHQCLLNRLFGRRSKKTSKLRVTGLCSPRPVNSPHKWPVTREMFPLDDVIMILGDLGCHFERHHLVHWS